MELRNGKVTGQIMMKPSEWLEFKNVYSHGCYNHESYKESYEKLVGEKAPWKGFKMEKNTYGFHPNPGFDWDTLCVTGWEIAEAILNSIDVNKISIEGNHGRGSRYKQCLVHIKELNF